MEGERQEVTRPAPPALAICREVPASFATCLRESDASIDVDRARRQHASYVDALRSLGITVRVLPALDELPDSVFVEDAAVITGRHALLTRPGAPSRRSEVDAIRDALAEHVDLQQVPPPATIDGGDVLRVGRRLFVGVSTRTNEEGVSELARVAALDGLETISIRVTRGLHLKSACTALDDSIVLYRPGCVDESALRSHGLTLVEAREAPGANVLVFGDDVLVSTNAPETNSALCDRGWKTRALDISEFQRGDGALSCLSLRLPGTSEWVT